MGAGYRQFCPVAKAMELLEGRWTLLIVRELVEGTTRFNDLRRGVPRLSPSLLSKRLSQLERAGVLERLVRDNEVHYVVTPAGKELRAVVEAMGQWGTRWVGELGDEDLDPRLLLWDMHRRVDHAAVPEGRTVIRFAFTEPEIHERTWWLVLTPAEADVCDADPGFPPALSVHTSLRTMTAIWRGDRSWGEALASGALALEGPAPYRRALPSWFTLSPFAAVVRPR